MRCISRRKIIVSFCFVVWIGTAGVICRAFAGRPMETPGVETVNPSQIVHAAAVHGTAPVRLAQR
jgi:hypothetical protein